jgi:two-component system, OmpR family, response regulator
MRPIAAHPLSDPYARSAVLIDRDPVHTERLAEALRLQGFTVHTARDGLSGLEMVRRFSPDLTILDVDLPGIDGYETIRRLRDHSDCCVLVVAEDDSESAVVEGFRSGADDYISKPYGPHALRARIDALLRRRSRPIVVPAAVEQPSGWLEHGTLRIHADSRRVEANGVECELTRSEFDILLTVARAKDRVFSKASLALMLRESVGLPDHHITAHDRHAVEVHVMNVRRKLGDDPRSPRWIETVRGFGYRMAPLQDVQVDTRPVVLAAV